MSIHWGSIIWQQFGAALDLLDDEKAAQQYEFAWGGGMSFAELMLYTTVSYTHLTLPTSDLV